MISVALALLGVGVANAQVELSARQNDVQFERRQTVKTPRLRPSPPRRADPVVPTTVKVTERGAFPGCLVACRLCVLLGLG